MTKLSLNDYVSFRSNPQRIALIIEHYTPEQWFDLCGVSSTPSASNTHAVCKVQWLDNQSSYTDYWYTSSFIKVEENLRDYLL